MFSVALYSYLTSNPVLHPKYKTTYFDTAKWQPDWIATAREMIRTEWETHYKVLIDKSFTPQSVESVGRLVYLLVTYSVISLKDNSDDDELAIFSELDKFGKSDAEDALDVYLSTQTDTESDPIQFWVSRLDKPGTKVTPRGALARMALDFLTAPGW